LSARPAVALALVAAAAGAAGCESTQAKSARLQAAAVNRPAEKGFTIGEPNRDVKVERALVLQDPLGAAVVVELRNTGRSAQARVPVGVTVTGAGGAKLYANDAPGLDASLTEAPLIEPGGRLLWVDDQVRITDPARRAAAEVGAALGKPVADAPRIELEGPKLDTDQSGAFTAVGAVRNASSVEQVRLVVFVTAERGGKIVAAGRSIVPRLKAGGKARFTAFLAGKAKGARLHATAPATVLG
jgi:hypothetical protein